MGDYLESPVTAVMHNLFLHSADIGITALFQTLLGVCYDPISFEPVSTTALSYSIFYITGTGQRLALALLLQEWKLR